MIEVSFVTGPLITAAVVALARPEVALAVSAALVVAGAMLFLVALPGDHGPIAHAHASGGARRPIEAGDPDDRADDAARRILHRHDRGLGAGVQRRQRRPGLAGVLLALWSVASAIGGLAFGLRATNRGLVETYVLIALLFPLACLPLAAASSTAAMAVLVMLAGAPVAPLIASRNELVAAVARRGTGTESFTWLLTALVAGSPLAPRSPAR